MKKSRFPTPNPSPRGDRRTIYVSDPSSIAIRYLPDPATEDSLRNWVDDLADAGTDTFIQEAYTQGWTTYWRTDEYEYDARPQHKRFIPLLDSGVQPLQILLDQSRRRGMEFLAGIRVNDNHGHISVEQGVGAGSGFLTDNPQFHVTDIAGETSLGSFLDFTYPEVRGYVASVVKHLLDNFDVDGIELCFRDQAYFPYGTERERYAEMTEFIRSVHDLVSQASRSRNRRLILGARVYATVDLCQDQGLDIEDWVTNGIIDYLAPSDIMYLSVNEPIDEFGEITVGTDCMLYPAIMPHSSARRIRFFDNQPLNLNQKRAAAQNFYAAGADGLSFYNHFMAIDWAPFYPMALHEMNELSEPDRVKQSGRNYVFEPMLGGQGIFEVAGMTTKGRPAPERIVLKREIGSAGKFRFRICEDLADVRYASLLFRAYNMTDHDEIRVSLNGQVIEYPNLKFRSATVPTHLPATSVKASSQSSNLVDHEKRIDQKAGADKSSHSSAGLSPVPTVPDSFTTGWFHLTKPPTNFGDNYLEVSLVSTDPNAKEDIVIEEIEVDVIP